MVGLLLLLYYSKAQVHIDNDSHNQWTQVAEEKLARAASSLRPSPHRRFPVPKRAGTNSLLGEQRWFLKLKILTTRLGFKPRHYVQPSSGQTILSLGPPLHIDNDGRLNQF